MSGGGGFRGRGFASRGHGRSGTGGPRRPNVRPNCDSRRGSGARGSPAGSRGGQNVDGPRANSSSNRGSRSNSTNSRIDTPKGKSGGGNYRRGGAGPSPSRGNFNVPRGQGRHQNQGAGDCNWSGNNWSKNNWSDDTWAGSNWSNNQSNNWSGNNWSDNNPGNNWPDNNSGNNWSDNNSGNNWSDNNSGNNWSPGGIGQQRGFPAWRGGGPPQRFNTPQPFFPPQGQNSFAPYGFPPPMVPNFPPRSCPEYPPNVEQEPAINQNEHRKVSDPGEPKNPPKLRKAQRAQKQTPHLGSEEERLQKITEAADKLKRKLSIISKAPGAWENENEDEAGALNFSPEDSDHEPRIANRGIPELKHDPPELNLTLNDLRDIGRVDHDHQKPNIDSCASTDDQEVEILEHDPVRRVPEATIDIDFWPEDHFNDDADNTVENANDETDGMMESTVEDSGHNAEHADENSNEETTPTTEDHSDEREAEGEKFLRDSTQSQPENETNEYEPQNPSDKENLESSMNENFEMTEKSTADANINEEAKDAPIQETVVSREGAGSETCESTQIHDDEPSDSAEDSRVVKASEEPSEDFEELEKTPDDPGIEQESNPSMNLLSNEAKTTCEEQAIDSKVQTEELAEEKNESSELTETEAPPIPQIDSTTKEASKETEEGTKISEEFPSASQVHNESEKSIADEETKENREKMTIVMDNVASVDELSMNEKMTSGSIEQFANVTVQNRTSEEPCSPRNESENVGFCDKTRISEEAVSEDKIQDAANEETGNNTKETSPQNNDETIEKPVIAMNEEEESNKIVAEESESTERSKESISKLVSRDSEENPSSRSSSKASKSHSKIDDEYRPEMLSPAKKTKDLKRPEHKNSEKLRDSKKSENPERESPSEDKNRDGPKFPRKGATEICPAKAFTLTDTKAPSVELYSDDCKSPLDPGSPPNALNQRESTLPMKNYGKASKGKRDNDGISSPPVKFDPNVPPPNILALKNTVEGSLPPAFDPRLSSHERSVILSSAIPISQDYGMTHGYPPCTITNLVQNVPAMNYVVPTGVPPPSRPSTIVPASMEPGSSIPGICMPDHYAPIIPLANVAMVPSIVPAIVPSIVPPMVLPSEMMLQQPPPLPNEPPPPLPPLAKSNLDMDAELEDMQEAMEFAKQFMNMNESEEREKRPETTKITKATTGDRDVLDADMSDESDIFHMPTFPDLPPIELPPLPPSETQKPTENIYSFQTVSKESSKKIGTAKSAKNEIVTYGPAPKPDAYRESPVPIDNKDESIGMSDEQLRPKVVFNLNTKLKRIGKHDEWHQQHSRDEEHQASSIATSSAPISSTEITKIRKHRITSTQSALSAFSFTREKSSVTNGHEERRKRDEKLPASRHNGRIEQSSPSQSQTHKNPEGAKSRSPIPTSHAKHTKSFKHEKPDPGNPTFDKLTTPVKRGNKETPTKKTNEPTTHESTWKSRVIGRFLKMSKNDIRNMLNNASLRKFDIAMQHLVKERRSSLSLEIRSNEEERSRDSEASYNREEFMDQLSAMLDPSATVDLCNIPTQFIQHLSEVLQLDTLPEFESSLASSEGKSEVLPALEESSGSSEFRHLANEPRETVKSREIDEQQQQARGKRRGKDKRPCGSVAEVAPGSTICLGTTVNPIEKRKIVRPSDKTMPESPRSESAIVDTVATETPPSRAAMAARFKRRRARGTIIDQQAPALKNGSVPEKDENSLNMADLDDIFSAGIARAKKKMIEEPCSRLTIMEEDQIRNDATTIAERTVAPGYRDPCVDRVERAVVELDEIFTAGIARAKLASKKAAEASKSAEADDGDDDDDERSWNHADLRSNLDVHRLRQKSSSSARHSARTEKWTRRKNREEPATFRNLTKEEWEAKYGESSYSSYQREYRAMEALRAHKSHQRVGQACKQDFATLDSGEFPSAKSRLGDPVSTSQDFFESWSGSEEPLRSRDVTESASYPMNNSRSSLDSSSSSSSSSGSSGKDDDEVTPSVTKLLKVIKEREKIAKQKSINEEIRDEVTAEIERKRREKDKVRKRHRPRTKKSSHHRRKREKKDKVREKKRRERKRRKRKSRRSGDENSRENSDNEDADEEYTSSTSRGRNSLRLLNEDEIKKEIIVKEEPDVRTSLISQKKRTKTTIISKTIDDSRPASTASSSSLPSIPATSIAAPSISAPSSAPPSTSPTSAIVTSTITVATLIPAQSIAGHSLALPSKTPSPIAAPSIAPPSKAPSPIAASSIAPPPKVASPSIAPTIISPSAKVAHSIASASSMAASSIASTSVVTSSAVTPSSTAVLTSAQQPKTKAQLKQMPVEITEKLEADAKSNVETGKNPETRGTERPNENIEETRDSKVSSEISTSHPPEIPTILDDTVVKTALLPAQSSTQSTDASSKTNSKKLDIKTYKERARQRQHKENEKIRLITENPSSLTQDLLNIPLTRKKPEAITEAPKELGKQPLEPPAQESPKILGKEPLKDPRLMRQHDPTITPITDTKKSETTTVGTDECRGPLSQTNAEENISGIQPPRKKIIRRSSITNVGTSLDSQATKHHVPIDVGKFAHIKSEGSKELKLREKLKRSRSRSGGESLETKISQPQPTRLKRRPKNSFGVASTEETIVPATELDTTVQVPLSNDLKSSKTADDPETSDNSEKTSATKKIVDESKSCDSAKTVNIPDNLVPTIIAGNSPSFNTTNIFHESISLIVTGNADKTENLKTAMSSDNSKRPDRTNVSKIFNITEASELSKTLDDTVTSNNSEALDATATLDTPKSLEAVESVDDPRNFNPKESSECSQNLVETAAVSNEMISVGSSDETRKRDCTETARDSKTEVSKITSVIPTISDTLKKLDSPETIPGPESVDSSKNVTKASGDPSHSNISPPPKVSAYQKLQDPSKSEDSKNSATAIIPRDAKSLESPEKYRETKPSPISGKSSSSVEAESRESLAATKKLQKVLESDGPLISLEIPLEEFPVWSLEAPTSNNIPGALDYSSDSGPFKGFSEETIIRRDRVLTEAEITEGSEINVLESLPVNFIEDETASTAENLDIDSLTNTEVAVTLDVALPYIGEEFVETSDDIRSSLSDPLGNAIFSVANEIVDVPGAIELVPLESFGSEEASGTILESREPVVTSGEALSIDNFITQSVDKAEDEAVCILVREAGPTAPEPEFVFTRTNVIGGKTERETIEPLGTKVAQAYCPGKLLINNLTKDSRAVGSMLEKKPLQCNATIGRLEKDICIEIETALATLVDDHSSSGLPDARDKNNDTNTSSKELAERPSSTREKILESSVTEGGEKNSSSQMDEEKRNKETGRSNSENKRDTEGAPKDSHHHSRTREHGHGRSKKKSSRHHSHGSRTTKKSNLSVKMVEDAVSANVVKLVAKPTSKDSVMARMIEIDVEIHKLMNEKMTLYKMLESGDFTSHENQEIGVKAISEEARIVDKEGTEDVRQTNVLASRLVKNLTTSAMPTKVVEEASKKPEAKKIGSSIDEKMRKRRKSFSHETNTRSRDRDAALESKEDGNPEETLKIHSSRITVSEEPARRETPSRCSREKSTSSGELEETEEKRGRRRIKSPSRRSKKRSHAHSSREDLPEFSRENEDRSEITAKNNSRDRAKKKAKTSNEHGDTETVKKLKIDEERSGALSSTAQKNPSTNVIYSDESTRESQEPETPKTNEKPGKKDTSANASKGLSLLEQSFHREIAKHRRVKNLQKRKSKKRDLRRALKDATILSPVEVQTGLINLLNRKKLKKKNHSTSELPKDVRVWKHVSSVIDAVAKNRVDELYARGSREIASEVRTLEKIEKTPERKGKHGGEGDEEVEARNVDAEDGTLRLAKESTDIVENSEIPDEAQPNVEADSKRSPFAEAEESLLRNDVKMKMEAEREPNEAGSVEDVPKTPEIDNVEETVSKPDKAMIRDEEIADQGATNVAEKTVEPEIPNGDLDNVAEKRTNVTSPTRSRSESPEYPESSRIEIEKTFESCQEETRKGTKLRVGTPKIDETSGQTSEPDETIVDLDEERIRRSRSRSSRPTKHRGKSRNGRAKNRKTEEIDSDDLSWKHDNSTEHHEDGKSLRRPRSATYRGNKQREKSGPANRRTSRQSEDSAKSSRGKKRENDRSNSRGLSPQDGAPLRKRSNLLQRSLTPQPAPITSDENARKRGKKRKPRPELTFEEMKCCRVELIDCKFTYLSPTMHPKILRKLGIAKINTYEVLKKQIENSPAAEFPRESGPCSPPTLSKVVEISEFLESVDPEDNENKEIPELREISEPNFVSDKMEEEEVEAEGIKPAMECHIVKENVDDDEEDDEEDDDNIQIVKALDENLPIVETISEHDEVESIGDMIPDPNDQPDGNENKREVITFDEEEDTMQEYEVIDEVTDENEDNDEPEPANIEVEIIEEKEAGHPSTEKTNEPEKSGERSPASEINDEDDENEPRRTRYTVHKGPILDIKVLDDSFLAASEDGAIYRYSQTSNGILNIYKGHEAAVTCIYVHEMPGKCWNLYSGSLDGTFRSYDITTGVQDRPANIGSPVQCMDQGWGIIYVGTKSGHISRYNIKAGGLKGDKLEFSDKSVLALKASAEGPRRVLIVASRNQPITIRDAHTGLFLRTICGYKNHTVYSLMRERNLVYCGTSSTSIPVYDFTNGEQVRQYNAGVGIVCMRLYRQILFAGCYDGNIYVFDTKESKLICSIPGPGNMLLSMEVVDDEIIAGSKNRQLHSWRMPKNVRALLAERT